jgi:hypothetical protein
MVEEGDSVTQGLLKHTSLHAISKIMTEWLILKKGVLSTVYTVLLLYRLRNDTKTSAFVADAQKAGALTT